VFVSGHGIIGHGGQRTEVRSDEGGPGKN
jgi:hypothetical protein